MRLHVTLKRVNSLADTLIHSLAAFPMTHSVDNYEEDGVIFKVGGCLSLFLASLIDYTHSSEHHTLTL